MYSQPPHGGMPPHLQSASSQAEYHSVRGEYPPPPEGYYPPPIPPHMGPPPMHPHYYEYPPPPHYMGYHPGPMTAGMPPQMPQPRPDDYDRNSLRRPKGQSSISGTATGSTGEADKSKGSKSNSSTSVLHKSRFRKERFGSFDSPSGREEEDRRKYTLMVCQQPLRARMCGFGEKDRRPIDPPPIVQLVVNDEKGNLDSSDLSMLQNPFFVLHVTLWSEDGRQERNVISNPPKTTRVLMGSLVSSPALLKNTEGEQGCYFCFPDLSIRTEGTYTLKFSLMKLGNEDRLIDSKSGIIATTFSNSFTVYSAKKFPGMTESTDLSKTFAKQGLKIPIRNDVRSRKVEQE